MDHIYSISEIKDILDPVLSSYGVKKAILFGSYSTGKPSVQSDIDLLVDSGLRGLRFIGFTEDLRLALGKEVDVFDVSQITRNSRIDNEISDTGVIVYEK